MSGQTTIWRSILWLERFLPKPAEYPPQRDGQGTVDAPTSRWRFAILPIVSLSVVLPLLVRERHFLTDVWPACRGMIEQLVLLLALGAGAAAIVAAIVTWRRERRNHA